MIYESWSRVVKVICTADLTCNSTNFLDLHPTTIHTNPPEIPPPQKPAESAINPPIPQPLSSNNSTDLANHHRPNHHACNPLSIIQSTLYFVKSISHASFRPLPRLERLPIITLPGVFSKTPPHPLPVRVSRDVVLGVAWDGWCENGVA
jgi:hypothetical protein